MSDDRVFTRLILTTEQIQQAVDRQTVEYEVPEWTTPEMRAAGQIACVVLRPLSVQNRDDLYRFASDTGLPNGKLDTLRFLRLVVVYGMITPQLTEDQVAMRAWGVVDRISNHIMDISGMERTPRRRPRLPFDQNPDLRFQFRLAQELHLTVGDLRQKVTPYEMQLWAAFFTWQRDAAERMRDHG